MTLNISKLTLAAACLLAATSLAASSIFAKGSAVVNSPPVFVAPSPCNQNIVVTPGLPLVLNFKATDADGDQILILWNNQPWSATTNPPTVFQTPPNTPATFVFTYTATLAEVGTVWPVIFACYDPSGGVTKCDFTITVEPPLAVVLSSFTASNSYTGGPAHINWSTSSEIDSAFFNVYKSQTTFADAHLVNGLPIMAKGNPVIGANYTLLDRRVISGATYLYWLEAVDIYGVSQLFGPIEMSAL